MYPVPATFDDPVDLVEADLPAVVPLEGTTGKKPAIMYHKNESLKERAVSAVEENVEEDLQVVVGHLTATG
jgi:hypothetical protein